MSTLEGLRCVWCSHEIAEDPLDGTHPLRLRCPRCSGNLEAVYRFPRLDHAALLADPDPTIWRWRSLLPVDPGPLRPRLPVGGTPLLSAPVLGAAFDLPDLWLKDDTRLPSASFKDRASAIALAVAWARGERVIAGASTGNAAASTACLGARTGQKVVIFVPHTAPAAKVAQILLFGATVLSVHGTYDQAFDLCAQACDRLGWYNRNTGLNPWTREGKKTCALEIAAQLRWELPDWVAVSVGDGNILSGLARGFRDLVEAGITDRVPRLLAAQAEGSDSVTRAWEDGGRVHAVSGTTIADSISVSLPRDGDAAVAALRTTRGHAIRVPDAAILRAMAQLARSEGVFVEPAAAVTIAGIRAAAEAGVLRSSDRVVAVLTGSGLKDVDRARQIAGEPIPVGPDPADLDRLIQAGALP